MDEHSSNESTSRPSMEDYNCATERRTTVHPEGTTGFPTPNNIATPLAAEIDPRDLMMQQLVNLVKAVVDQKSLP
jgi:hypothetical protein